MSIPNELKYTKDHEWIKVDGNIGIIGVTDYAQGQLGDIVFFDVVSGLEEFKPGDILGNIEAVKTVSELYAPVTGKFLEVNPALANGPEIVNQDPYGAGWMIKVELTNLAEIDELLDAAAYSELIGQ